MEINLSFGILTQTPRLGFAFNIHSIGSVLKSISRTRPFGLRSGLTSYIRTENDQNNHLAVRVNAAAPRLRVSARLVPPWDLVNDYQNGGVMFGTSSRKAEFLGS